MRELFDPLNHDHLRRLPGRIRDLSLLAQFCADHCGPYQSPTVLAEPMDELREELKLLALHVDLAVEDLLKRVDALEARWENKQEAVKRAGRAALAKRIETTGVGEFFDPEGYFVYILWGEGERPVYVGQSANILARLGAHFGNRAKRRLITKIQLVRCATRHVMDTTEADLIAHYRPQLNIAGNCSPLSEDGVDVA